MSDETPQERQDNEIEALKVRKLFWFAFRSFYVEIFHNFT